MAQNYVSQTERDTLDAAMLGYRTGFFKGLENAKTWWSGCMQELSSDTEMEEHDWLGAVPGFTEWKGARKFTALGRFKYRLTNRDWEGAGIKLPRNKILDGAGRGLAPIAHSARQAGRQAAKFPDRQCAMLMKNGHLNQRAFRCYNGQPYFSATHPIDPNNAGAGTFRNYRTAFALNEANLNAAIAEFMAMPDENGDVLGIAPVHLWVAPALRSQALLLLTAETVPNTLGTAPQTNINRGALQPHIIPELAGADTTWILTADEEIKPFLRQVRQRAMWKEIAGLDSQHCALHKEVLLGADSREEYGFTLPQLAYKCVG